MSKNLELQQTKMEIFDNVPCIVLELPLIGIKGHNFWCTYMLDLDWLSENSSSVYYYDLSNSVCTSISSNAICNTDNFFFAA